MDKTFDELIAFRAYREDKPDIGDVAKEWQLDESEVARRALRAGLEVLRKFKMPGVEGSAPHVASACLWKCVQCSGETTEPQIVRGRRGGCIVATRCEKCRRFNLHNKRANWISKSKEETDNENPRNDIAFL